MKKLIYPLASLLGLCACSQQTDFLPAEQRGEEIVLNGGIGELTTDVTRAPIESTHAAALDVAVARIDQTAASTWTAWKDSPTLQAQRAATNGTAAITFKSGNEQYYTTNQDHNGIRFCAWYPFVAADANGKVTFTIDGKTDILYANPIEGSATDKFSSSNKVFSFRHLLARFTVKAYGDAAGYANWGNITEIKFIGMRNKVEQTLGSAAAYGVGNSIDFFLKNMTSDVDVTGVSLSYSGVTTPASAITCGYLMAAAVYNGGWDDYVIQVTTTKGGTRKVTINLHDSAGVYFSAGNHYTVYLNFQSTAIAPSASIAAWTTSSNNPPAGIFPNP